MPDSGIRAYMLMNRVQLISVHLMQCNEKAVDHDPVGLTSWIACWR